MKRQPLIFSQSQVFNFSFNLLGALSLVFIYFSPAEYNNFALIKKCINVVSLAWMSVTEKCVPLFLKKSCKMIFFSALFENLKKKPEMESLALKFMMRSKGIMHIDFSQRINYLPRTRIYTGQ